MIRKSSAFAGCIRPFKAAGRGGLMAGFIGLRPGEKLFEELFYADERVFPSACEKIAYTESAKLAWPELKHALDALYIATSLGERDAILSGLRQIVPQFSWAEVQGTAGVVAADSTATLTSPLASGPQPETKFFADRPRLPHRSRPLSPHGNPSPLGAVGDLPGD